MRRGNLLYPILVATTVLSADDYTALFREAAADTQQGKYEEAVLKYKAALAITPSDQSTRFALANLFADNKHYADAAYHYDILVQQSPNNDVYQNARGIAHEAVGEHKVAYAAFTAAVTVNPKNAIAWNNLGVVNEKMGDRKSAIADYKHALDADPKLSEAKANLARFNVTQPAMSIPGTSTPDENK